MKSPTHTCWNVRDRGETKKPFWIPIGSAWTNKDGSFNLLLDVLPVDGRICVRPRKEDEGSAEQQIDFAND